MAGLFLVLAAAAGCGGPPRLPIHGQVTLDGAPVAAGDIVFLPSAGEGSKAAAAIQDGAYALADEEGLPPGSYRVEIRWPKPTGRKIPSADPGMTMDELREAIPARYNSESTLVAEITAGATQQNFELKSK